VCHAPRFLLIALTGVALSACSYPSLDGDESLPEILAQLDSEIVGGTNVTSGWESVVYLSVGGGECTGTLISPDVVLTAAHCLQGVWGAVDVVWTNNISQSHWGWISSNDHHAHPQYNPGSMANDIGVIVLPQAGPGAPVPINEDTPNGNWTGNNHPLTFVGFGVTSGWANDSGVKRKVDIAVDNHDGNFLYYYDNQHNTCYGDSGGPAFTDHNGGWQVAGVTSWGDQNCSQMGANTRTDVHVQWIEGYTGGWSPGGPGDDDDDDDGDGDGDGYTPGQGDCDDDDPTVHPGAPETPDHVDEDCDGQVDEGTDYYDDDGDGYTEADGDCDDNHDDVHPNAPEAADHVDNDCDGKVDEGTPYYDDDGDGYTEAEGDCDDGHAGVHPGAPEYADGLDNDCNGFVDEGMDAGDDDGDGYSEADGDCDDNHGDVHPGAPEVADHVDNDCDGLIDEGTDYYDDDGDGFSEAEGDCDDDHPGVNPIAPEYADGLDNDCDGQVDEDMDEGDADGDGFSEAEGDCDDHDPSVHPGAPDRDNGRDDDCDGQVDELANEPPGGPGGDEYEAYGCRMVPTPPASGALVASLAACLALARRRSR